MKQSVHRVFILLDADGARRGFVTDAGTTGATIDGSGAPVYFGPGLEVETLPVRSASMMGETAADAGSLSATLALDALDLWALRDRCPVQRVSVRAWLAPVDASGRPDDDGTSNLRREWEIFRGVIRQPQWDLGARTLTFTAAPDLRIIDAMFPPAALTRDRFDGAPNTDGSTAVPVLYGSIYGLPVYACSDTTANPVRLLIAGHPIVSETVSVYRDGLSVVAGGPVLYANDDLGGSYAYVKIPKVDYEAGSSLYLPSVVGWRGPDGRAIDGLGDVLLHLWHTYSAESFLDIDRSRAYAARADLNRYTVSSVFNSQESGSGLLRILQGRYEGQFPVAFGIVGGRIGWDSTRVPTQAEIPTRVVGTLRYGHDAHTRIGPREGDAAGILTKLEANIGLSGSVGGTFIHVIADRTNMPAFRTAVSRWGESPMQRLDLPDVSTQESAWSVMTDMATARSVLRESVTYAGLDGDWHRAPLFGVILVTDDDCGYDAEPHLITSVAPDLDGTCAVTLLRVAGT